jgi:hypothetical protein
MLKGTEALSISRALEGRVLPGPGAVALPEPLAEAAALTLDPASFKTLPSHAGGDRHCRARRLIYANNAFAFASVALQLNCSKRAACAILPSGAPLTQATALSAARRSRRSLLAAKIAGCFRADCSTVTSNCYA